jgi:hypothetical protein
MREHQEYLMALLEEKNQIITEFEVRNIDL